MIVKGQFSATDYFDIAGCDFEDPYKKVTGVACGIVERGDPGIVFLSRDKPSYIAISDGTLPLFVAAVIGKLKGPHYSLPWQYDS